MNDSEGSVAESQCVAGLTPAPNTKAAETPGVVPLLTDPVVTRCRTCFKVLRDERPHPGARYRMLIDECAACRVERGGIE